MTGSSAPRTSRPRRVSIAARRTSLGIAEDRQARQGLEASVESIWPRSRTARAWSFGPPEAKTWPIEGTARGSVSASRAASASALPLRACRVSPSILQERPPVLVRLGLGLAVGLDGVDLRGGHPSALELPAPSFFQAASRDGSSRVTAVSWAIASASRPFSSHHRASCHWSSAVDRPCSPSDWYSARRARRRVGLEPGGDRLGAAPTAALGDQAHQAPGRGVGGVGQGGERRGA